MNVSHMLVESEQMLVHRNHRLLRSDPIPLHLMRNLESWFVLREWKWFVGQRFRKVVGRSQNNDQQLVPMELMERSAVGVVQDVVGGHKIVLGSYKQVMENQTSKAVGKVTRLCSLKRKGIGICILKFHRMDCCPVSNPDCNEPLAFVRTIRMMGSCSCIRSPCSWREDLQFR